MFSFLTDIGVYTPTRVRMRGTDSVAYCQSSVQDMFADELYRCLLIWLDDLLGYSKTKEGLLAALERVLKICEFCGLKLNPKKCLFYQTGARWCGRNVSGDGVKHDPERIKALQDLKVLATGQGLQQFICAMNWMCTSIPRYNVVVGPLADLMERVYTLAGGRTRQKVSKIPLSEAGWDGSHVECLAACKKVLGQAVTLAHPKSDKLVCVFADASDLHWGGVVTQIPPEQADRELDALQHEPLMFLSGTFSGAAQRWAIVEKEPGGFALFTDHANLKCIFNPTSVNAAIPKYTATKLDRWALLLMRYDYTIYDIAGEANVWADLLSRWETNSPTICPIVHVPLKISPPRNEEFVWPSMAEIVDAQLRAVGEDAVPEVQLVGSHVLVAGEQFPVLKMASDAVWIPLSEGELQMRLCVVAHFGMSGHRGVNATRQILSDRFWWPHMGEDVAFFVGRCLHCAATGGHVLRPFGMAPHATKPSEILHWNFLYMENGYLHVAKDDFSQLKWFWETDVANAQVVARCLLQWFGVFGVCYHWVTDQGSHFKNAVIAELQHMLGAHHHFTTARCPWANGTVESAMKITLKTFRALYSECLMQPEQWRQIVPTVMLVLNQTPSETIGGIAPITAMTGSKPMSPLDLIPIPGSAEVVTLQELWDCRFQEWAALQDAVEKTHQEVLDASSSKRKRGRAARAKKKGVKMAEFDVGDYVLYMDVWGVSPSKLSVTWRGPAQVVKATSGWIFEIQNLITGIVREAHASRLKFYADESLNVDEELLSHVAHNADGHVVDHLVDCRFNPKTAAFEVLVSWRGLQEIENSWKPATKLLEDIPVC
ncbi:hypothetical protein Ae201684P_007025 [Aphanomyces euteiches]|nr:hypothetical protein Ae201684P_007025 [Aphanomyces euteiches]